MKPEVKEDDSGLMDLMDGHVAEPEASEDLELATKDPTMDTEKIVVELRALLDKLEAQVG